MLSIETQLIILVILIVSLFMLGWGRSQLFQRATKEIDHFPQLADLTPPTTALIYLGLLGGTWLLMFSVALIFSLVPFSLTLLLRETLIAVGLSLIQSFFVILTLQKVLSLMRQYKQLPISLVVNFSVLWMVCLIVAVELSFLYWMKEVTIYFTPPFSVFVVLYSLLILGVAGVLSLRTYDNTLLRNWKFVSVAILDSVLVVLLATIFLQIIIITILH